MNDLTEREALSLRIGATQEAIARLAEDILEDEAVLATYHDGTADEDCQGWADEDECASFVASSHMALTRKQAELEGLQARLDALVAKETTMAAAA